MVQDERIFSSKKGRSDVSKCGTPRSGINNDF